MRFVFPHARVRPVTLNMGMRMRAWYDIKTLTAEGRADEEGIRESVAVLEQLIAAERAAGIASERIVIAGFSQGAAVALHGALRHAEPLGGILALSCYLPLQALLAGELAEANRATPILMCHGQHDPGPAARARRHGLQLAARERLPGRVEGIPDAAPGLPAGNPGHFALARRAPCRGSGELMEYHPLGFRGDSPWVG